MNTKVLDLVQIGVLSLAIIALLILWKGRQRLRQTWLLLLLGLDEQATHAGSQAW